LPRKLIYFFGKIRNAMDRQVYVIFVAGGSGTRMGGSVPKQFLRLGGRTVLQRTMERFLEALPGMKAVTVLPRAHFRTWKNICLEDSFNCPQILVEGGITRFQSVRNALEKVPDGAVVMIHDGVRPFVSPELIRRLLAMMDEGGGVIPALPVTDTLRSTVPGVPDPDRSAVVAVQTPQVFLSEDIKRAYGRAYELSFTDDASVAASCGIAVRIAEGEKFNIKITTPEDLVIAEAILSRQQI
jgi:2-C-methyl-D-erythritol 4-phosphate cytidylyltransferase